METEKLEKPWHAHIGGLSTIEMVIFDYNSDRNNVWWCVYGQTHNVLAHDIPAISNSYDGSGGQRHHGCVLPLRNELYMEHSKINMRDVLRRRHMGI